MSLLRCCCASSGEGVADYCFPCPTPISPYTATQWSVSVSASGIVGQSDGSGALALGGVVKSCQRGSCGGVQFRRKAISNDTLAMLICDETDYCNAMLDQAAPTRSGSSQMEWTQCRNSDGDESPGSFYYPDVAYTYSDAVRIVRVAAHSKFVYNGPNDFNWTGAPLNHNDCRSVVEVEYKFTDSFDYPYFEDVGGNCVQIESTYNISQMWRCVYSKRPTTGQYLAQGQYALVAVSWPTGARTHGPVGSTCAYPGGQICNPNGITPVSSPTVWQPPPNVLVVRVA